MIARRMLLIAVAATWLGGCASFVGVSFTGGGALKSTTHQEPAVSLDRPLGVVRTDVRVQFERWSLGLDAESWPRDACCTGFVAGGASQVPHPWSSRVGYEALGRVGFGTSSGEARFAAGLELGLPIRLTSDVSRARLGADDAFAIALVPFATATEYFGASSHFDLSVGAALRLILTLNALR